MRCLVVICLLTDLDSTASAHPVLILLLEDTVRRMIRDLLVFVFVDSCVPLAGGADFIAALIAAYFFCVRVLPADVSSIGANLTADWRFLCCLAFLFPVWFVFACFFSILGDVATGTL